MENGQVSNKGGIKKINYQEYYNHWIPRLIGIGGVVLFKQIFYARSEEEVSDRLRKHERTNVEQQRRNGVVFYTIKYIYEYLKGRLKGKTHRGSYLNISYEIEARKVEGGQLQSS